jgi:hypothetical protein
MVMNCRETDTVHISTRPAKSSRLGLRASALMSLGVVIGMVGAPVRVDAQLHQKRNRGEGMYRCVSSNTVGSGNVWVSGRAIGFIWDAVVDPQNLQSRPTPRAFLELKTDIGLFDISTLIIESRVISYPWNKKPQFGTLGGGAKFTIPNNEDLRLYGFGLQLKYIHSFLEKYSSIAGYRVGGTGFTAEGFLVEGGSIEILGIADFDFISLLSFLPFKVSANLGVRIPAAEKFRSYSQFLVNAGLSFSGTSFDAFVEYSLESFINRSVNPAKVFAPKLFDMDKMGGVPKRFEIAFSENPMFLTIGGRYRYESGITLFGAVPFLLSTNKNSDITYYGYAWKIEKEFPDEFERGARDPFDPWYAKWKVIAELTFPIHFKPTSAEMRRIFLLMKNRKKEKKIDIDDRLKIIDEETGKESEKEKARQREEDRKERLEEIRRRRQEFTDPE